MILPERGDTLGLFNWAAPVFGHYADRWSDESIAEISGWLRPYLPQGARGNLLDVGGGTGALALRLQAALDANVTVLDPTPEMLRYIPPDGRVRPVLGSAEAMPFDANEFDVLLVSDAFHHFRDQSAAVREFRRVVRCGGGVLIGELDPTGWLIRTIAFGERLLGEPASFHTPAQMCEFMRANGIPGECTRISGPSYRFVGRVV